MNFGLILGNLSISNFPTEISVSAYDMTLKKLGSILLGIQVDCSYFRVSHVANEYFANQFCKLPKNIKTSEVLMLLILNLSHFHMFR